VPERMAYAQTDPEPALRWSARKDQVNGRDSVSGPTGYSAWGSRSTVGDGQFTSARLVAVDGTVLATASLPRS
jgi:hypothetical protein